jgi:hypothetical protein
MPDEAPAGLEQALLQARQRLALDGERRDQPTQEIAAVIGDNAEAPEVMLDCNTPNNSLDPERGVGHQDRRQPELRRLIISIDMDVRRLAQVVAHEVPSVRRRERPPLRR